MFYQYSVCFNHLLYADDCVLLAPSPRALQLLIDICCNFTVENDLVFNQRKTKSMMVFPKSLKNNVCPAFYVNDTRIVFVEEEVYLGYVVRNDMCDDASINKLIRGIYARGNMIRRKFNECTEEVKVQLFRSYCSSFYCCSVWDLYKQESIRRIKVCHNNVLRFLIKARRGDSISHHFVSRNLPDFDVLRRKLVYSMLKRVQDGNNILISTIVESDVFVYSRMCNKWIALLHN